MYKQRFSHPQCLRKKLDNGINDLVRKYSGRREQMFQHFGTSSARPSQCLIPRRHNSKTIKGRDR